MRAHSMRLLMQLGTLTLAACLYVFVTRSSAQHVPPKIIPGGTHGMTSLVTLSAKPAVSDAGLTVHYSIDNHSSKPVYVFNKLWTRGPSALDVEPAYRYLVGKTLRLLLGPAPLPPGMNVRVRNVPCVTRVEPYRRMDATIDIPLPAKEYSAYFDPDAAKYAPTQARDVELFVSYRTAEGVETTPFAGAPDVLQITSAGPAAGAQLLRSGVIALPIEVLAVQGERFGRLELGEDR